jgi:hypothetical protein
MRDWAKVVEELAEQVPAAFALHNIRTEQKVPGDPNRIFQQKFASPGGMYIAQAFIRRGVWAIGGLCSRGKPSFVNAAAMRTKGVQVIRMKLQPAPRNHERTGNPARFQMQNTRAGMNSFLNGGSI